MNAVAIRAPRLPYHPAVQERFGIDQGGWRVLTDAVFPAAESPESIIMALAYCQARRLDIFKKPVQIVPIWDKKSGRMVDTVWPGIAELRTTAMRTGSFAGFEETVFGPMIDAELGGLTISYPEWAQCTVYRIVGGVRVPFVGPKVYWVETYATAKKDSKAPNAMWAKRPRGQLEKCAEAAALRRAFPEELGNEYAAEEVEGQNFSVRDITPPRQNTGLEARLAAPAQMPTEGFGAVNGLDPDDQIPDFGDGSPDAAGTAPADSSPAEGDTAAAGLAEANAVEETGPAAGLSPVELLAWADTLKADLDGLSLEQIDAILASDNEKANFAQLQSEQPQVALDLNRAIGRRKRELAG